MKTIPEMVWNMQIKGKYQRSSQDHEDCGLGKSESKWRGFTVGQPTHMWKQ